MGCTVFWPRLYGISAEVVLYVSRRLAAKRGRGQGEGRVWNSSPTAFSRKKTPEYFVVLVEFSQLFLGVVDSVLGRSPDPALNTLVGPMFEVLFSFVCLFF